ncbi:chemotaxis protein [Paraburkholderia ginsengiterrae]|uniref:Chemotaxis protein n=1 Tax=Paraburkholderia ginsengiterrae TaxID=1462993 RepID=A0A1A9NB29_9BURK|nr:methyl-accepting chemotaxis protein [Paraburkholderia ginsengiterrae]OAJ62481.1 chemotaxis protein [Paraburkholderia ginsengiterrae]OAJ62608.1 chemotaxis protein [Paraburkholderia ginsengiterrae]
MTISNRLLSSISIALLSMLTVGIVGLWQINQAQNRFEYFQNNVTQAIKNLTDEGALVYRDRILDYRYVIFTSSAKREALESEMRKMNSDIGQVLNKYEKDDITNDADRKLLDLDRAKLADFISAQSHFIAQVKANDMQGAAEALDEGGAVREANRALQKALDDHIAFNVQLGVDLRNENLVSHTRTVWILTAIIALATVLAGGMAIQLHRVISSSLSGMRDSLQHVKMSLDLTRRAPVERMDEIGHTATAFNELLTRVAEAVGSVRLSSESVTVAAKEIAAGNTDLSARTEEQAASLEETAASMTQLTETVKQNAENARQANALAARATDMADAGNESVLGMVGTIEDISGSSSKISEITGVIEGIAFQTNILALNAAVEAARAGEQGRGFAVVASEVRSLAQRSATAAKEIKELITASVSKIQDGSRQAAEVSTTMGQVKQAIKQVSDIVGEIAAASEEQSRGIEQVNQAVGQMDEVTQQNAALVEQAAAAAQSLEEQATSLKDVVSVFKVADA